jgi:hypothetical protein
VGLEVGDRVLGGENEFLREEKTGSFFKNTQLSL